MDEICIPLTNRNYSEILQRFIASRVAEGGAFYVKRDELDVLADYLAHCAGYMTNILMATIGE